jgi:hypothetical protein
MYEGSSYAPKAYRKWLGDKMSALMSAQGFNGRATWPRPARKLPAFEQVGQPTLF